MLPGTTNDRSHNGYQVVIQATKISREDKGQEWRPFLRCTLASSVKLSEWHLVVLTYGGLGVTGGCMSPRVSDLRCRGLKYGMEVEAHEALLQPVHGNLRCLA